MDRLEDMATLDRGEETFRLVAMLQLLLQAMGTLWAAMQHAVLTFLLGMFSQLTKLRWGMAPRGSTLSSVPKPQILDREPHWTIRYSSRSGLRSTGRLDGWLRWRARG